MIYKVFKSFKIAVIRMSIFKGYFFDAVLSLLIILEVSGVIQGARFIRCLVCFFMCFSSAIYSHRYHELIKWSMLE